MSRLALLSRIARAEGARGLAERLRERREEARDLARYRLRARETVLGRAAEARVLHVLPSPLEARRGGVQQALAARLRVARRDGTTALLELRNGRWWLRVDAPGTEAVAAPMAEPRLAVDEARTEALAEVLDALARRLGRAPLWHLEQASGLDFDRLAALARRSPLVLSTHDFALFCERVDLLEAPLLRYCGASRDEGRCRSCRQAAGVPEPPPQEARRRAASELLSACRAVVHPSEFVRRQHAELFPDARPHREVVIPPAIDYLPAAPRPVESPPRHVAFVGQASIRKGLPDFVDAVRALAAAAKGVRFSVLGGGDPDLLRAARRAGLHLLGYYRAATLPRRLVEHRIDLAVLPSRFPETHCLALDGCVAAGVPVLTSGMGALGERVGAGPDGWLAALERRITEITSCSFPSVAETAPASSLDSARAHSNLYSGFASDSPRDRSSLT